MASQRSPPYLDCQAGSGATDAGGDASVSFARAFSGVPKVFLQGVDAAAKGIVLDVVSKTAAGFAAKAHKVTGLPTGQALQGMHYYTASAVTGIPAATGSAGGHSHGTSSGTFVTSVSYATASFVTGGTDPGHSHTNPTTSGPSSTATVPSSTHTHSGTTGAPSATVTVFGLAATQIKYAANTSGGSPTFAFEAITNTANYTPASGTHTHDITTGAPSATISVASFVHTHTQGDTGSSATGITLYVASAVTSVSVGTASAITSIFGVGDHSHSIAAASTADFVTGLTILPEDWLTVVTGDSPTLAVDFDYLAILP